MAIAPSAEQCARRILEIFADKKVRAGEILMAGHVNQAFLRDTDYRATDYESGLGYAIDRAWLEPTRTSVRLLDAGFAEM